MFKGLNNLVDLSVKLVEAKRDNVYHWVYLFIKLVLLPPVATASVERIFSPMTFIKNKLRNKIGDSLLADCLVTFIEQDIFLQLTLHGCGDIANSTGFTIRRQHDSGGC